MNHFDFIRAAHIQPKSGKKKKKKANEEIRILDSSYTYAMPFLREKIAVTLNNAITTEKKLINAVAKIRGLENTAGLLYTWV